MFAIKASSVRFQERQSVVAGESSAETIGAIMDSLWSNQSPKYLYLPVLLLKVTGVLYRAFPLVVVGD